VSGHKGSASKTPPGTPGDASGGAGSGEWGGSNRYVMGPEAAEAAARMDRPSIVAARHKFTVTQEVLKQIKAKHRKRVRGRGQGGPACG
jgi:hypothetical protein